MNSDAIIQISLAAASVFTAMFFTIRYVVKENQKGKDTFMKYMQDQSELQLEYYERKNGHLERISKSFATTINKNTKAIEKLTNEINYTPKNKQNGGKESS